MLEIDHHIHVAGTGSYVPDRVVTNDELEELVSNYDAESGPFAAWVDRVSHIRERRFLDLERSAGEMAREACVRAFESSGVAPSQIDLFVMATFTTKNLYPGEHARLADELGMDGPATFYLTAACAGSVYALQVATAFLKAGFARHALVVGTEHLSSVVDFSDPLTAILFGDGAGAVVLSRREEAGPGGVSTACTLRSRYVPGNIMMDNANSPPPSRQVTVQGDGRRRKAAYREYLRMEGGPRVLRSAIQTMVKDTLASLGYTTGDLKDGNDDLRELLGRVRLVPHQANGRIIDGLRDKLGLSEEQVFKTIYHYGNISCASNVITLDYAIRRGNMRRIVDEEDPALASAVEEDVPPRIAPGDLVVVPTVGAGYLTGCFTFVHE